MGLAGVVVSAAACKGRRGDERSQLDVALVAADALYAQRADEEKLREAQQAYFAMLADTPDDPEVLWRLSRAYTAFGYGYPDSPADLCGSPGEPDPALCYTLALEFAFRCMEANPAWSSRLAINDGHISKRVAAALGEREVPCVREGVQAWTRWTELRGPSAALYLESISWLSKRMGELNEEDEGARPDWVSDWGVAMGQALAPEATLPDMAVAEASFEAAIVAEAELATPRADRAIHLLAQSDSVALDLEIERIREDCPTDDSHPWALENRRALERLESVSTAVSTEGADSLR